jgi:general secretion pathway protein D
MKRPLVPLLLTLALAAQGAAEPAGENAIIALNFQDVELPVLAKFVSEVTGRNFIVDDRVRGKVTIISPTRITPEEAYLVFQSVLQVKGFTTVPSGSFTKIVPVRDARETTVPTGGRGDEVVTRILPLAHAEAAALVPVLQPLVSKDGLVTAHAPSNSLVVVDAAANVERVAGLLAELDGPGSGQAVEVVRCRYAAAEELAPRLREALGAATEGDGLRVIADARSNALVLTGAPDAVRRAKAVVGRLDQAVPPGSTRVNVYRLRYADADGMVRVLARLIGQPLDPPPPPRARGSSFMRTAARHDSTAVGYDGGLGEPPPPPPPVLETAPVGAAGAVPLEAPVRLTADPATNAVVVSATPEDWETLRRVIEQLDVRRRQVFVEAIILEASLEKTRALGVEFRAGVDLDGGQGLAQADLGRLGALAGAAANPLSFPGLLLAAVSNERVTLPDGRRVPAHTVLLTALETDSSVNVLSAPNLVTTDNQEAEIVVGRNVPFVASRATSASNLSNLFTTIERHDVGITLRLTPQITADDYVHLTLFEEVSDIDPTAAPVVGDPSLVGPTTTIRSASTAVAARDGQTIVIGGLLADTLRSGERRIPFLGRIPVLGVLFRRDDDQRTKTNLLVFLTPHIIASDTQMAENAAREREHMRSAMPPRLRRHPKLDGPSWQEP